MKQLEEAKKAVKEFRTSICEAELDGALLVVSECLLSIAVSLDEANELAKAAKEERYSQAESLIQKVDDLRHYFPRA